MQGPDEPELQSSGQAPWNTAPGQGREPAGASEPDDRSEVHQQRQERGVRRLHDRPSARARSDSSLGLSSTGPSSLPPSPALPPQVCPRKVPTPTQRPTRWKEKGRPISKFSWLASLSSRLPGSARQRVLAVTTFLARAQEQQSRSPDACTRGGETREGFPARGRAWVGGPRSSCVAAQTRRG